MSKYKIQNKMNYPAAKLRGILAFGFISYSLQFVVSLIAEINNNFKLNWG